MSVSFDPIERMTVGEEITRRLIDLINSGGLKPGDKLPSERDLVEQFQVSRSSVREALRSLSLTGLLETRPGDGTYVTEHLSGFIAGQIEWSALLVERDMVELMEVREPLEIQAASLAAQRATSPQVERLRQAVEQWATSDGDVEREVNNDLCFHSIVAEMTHNRTLYHLTLSLQNIVRRYIVRVRAIAEISPVAEHQRILDAIADGDAARARQAMAHHMQISKQFALRDGLSRDD